MKYDLQKTFEFFFTVWAIAILSVYIWFVIGMRLVQK